MHAFLLQARMHAFTHLYLKKDVFFFFGCVITKWVVVLRPCVSAESVESRAEPTIDLMMTALIRCSHSADRAGDPRC